MRAAADGVAAEQNGLVYVKMESIGAAAAAATAMHGRMFAGKTIDAEFLPESIFVTQTVGL